MNDKITKIHGDKPWIGVPIYSFPNIELRPMPKIVSAKPVAIWLDIKNNTNIANSPDITMPDRIENKNAKK